MKAFADQRKPKLFFHRHAPAVAVDQSGRARCLQRGQIRHILDSPRPQFKFTVGPPNDVYEQEANRVADEVMRMPDPVVGEQRILRMCPECEEDLQRQPGEEVEEEEMQREPVGESEEEIEELGEPAQTLQAKSDPGGGSVVASGVASEINSLRGSGEPLPESVRRFFEPRFGRDFSAVRVHTDARAAETARAINARAYTMGNNVALARGEYTPASTDGRRLLAHELTHVVQQGAVSGPASGGQAKSRAMSSIPHTSDIAPQVVQRVATGDVFSMSLMLEGMSQNEIVRLLNEITPAHPRYCEARPNIERLEEMALATPAMGFGRMAGPLTTLVVNSPFRPPHRPNHTGIDYQAATGTPVLAALGGRVSYVRGKGRNCAACGYGLNVRVDHGTRGTVRLMTRYAHLSSQNVAEEDCVSRGQVMGLSGNTGHTEPAATSPGDTVTGAHLHFEVRENGRAVDPATYLG